MAEIVVYHTGHEKSYEVCRRISESTGFKLAHVKDYAIGTIPIVYGLFRGTDVVMRKAYWSGLGFWYVDHGYFKPGHYDGYYRFVKNGMFHNTCQYGDSTRWNKLQLTPSPPILGNNKAVICAPNLEGSMFFPFEKLWPEEWVEGVKIRLESFGYDVIVSTKHVGNRLVDGIGDDAGILVAHQSNAIVWGLMRGMVTYNIYYKGGCTIYESNRLPYLHHLANNQFKLVELTPEHFYK